MEINGLPLHPLVVHAVVVFAPLAAVFALAYALKPQWRWALRWPLAAGTLIALVGAVVAAQSGRSLLNSRPALEGLAAVSRHISAGTRLRNVTIVFAVAVALAVWRLGGPSGLVSGKGAREVRGGAADIVLTGLLALTAVAVLVTVFLAGDSGARAVWG